MQNKITSVNTVDVRFPTSLKLDGSDAMNEAPDYSAAYVVIQTTEGMEGHGLTFTTGRGNELCVAGIKSLSAILIDRDIDGLFNDLGGIWKDLTGDSQLRWVGPEKGVIHLAAGALMSSIWDLYSKTLGKPLWQVLSEMDPKQTIDLIDWTYLRDALDPCEALERLQEQLPGREERTTHILKTGYPAYTTSVGWLGYSDEKMRRLCQEALDQGWTHFKMKVGGDHQDDLRRASILRDMIGPNLKLMMDANQVWGVDETITKMGDLGKYDPWWIEEPTSPDDIIGHSRIAKELAPIQVATGEHCHNAVMFKQLLQAKAISFLQLDSCRLAGPNEIVATLLLADKFRVPVCPHAGGVGLCEYVQHISIYDYIAVSGSLENRILEYVDHLHEHFVDPVKMEHGRYMAPTAPGYSITMKRDSIKKYRYPDGDAWRL